LKHDKVFNFLEASKRRCLFKFCNLIFPCQVTTVASGKKQWRHT